MATPPPDDYARDRYGLVRQCPWCGRLLLANGEFTTTGRPPIKGSSSATCPECRDKLRQEIDATD